MRTLAWLLLLACGMEQARAEDVLAPDKALAYQEVTLKDGKVLSGRLNPEHTQITLVNLKTGKDMGTMSVAVDTIASVTEKSIAAAEDPDANLPPQDRALKKSERTVLKNADALNRAKQRRFDSDEAHTHWNTVESKKPATSKADFDAHVAKLERLHKEMKESADGVPIAQKNFDDSLAEYKKLGGTRDFLDVLKEPQHAK